MKWLLVLTPLLGGPIHPDALLFEPLYSSLNDCQDAVESTIKGMTPGKEAGIAFCYAVDPEHSEGRLLGQIATPGRTGWLPYSILGGYQFKGAR